MNILMVSPMPPGRQALGAIPLVLNAQLAALKSRHSLTWVTVGGPDPCEWRALDRLRAAGVRVAAVYRREPLGMRRWARRWRWATKWLDGRYPWRTIWFWEPEVQRILDRLLTTDSFDLIQVEDNAMGIYRYPTETPILFTEHEVRPLTSPQWEDPTRTFRSAALDRLRDTDWRRWRRYQRGVWKRFARVQVFTSRDARAVREIAPELTHRVTVNPFGIELPARLDPGREQDTGVIFIGNFTHPPNVDAALWLGNEIMPLLRARVPGAHLDLAGAYPPSSIRALARDDIQVLGHVPELEAVMARAGVVIAPLRTGGGQRMKVLQSMASGKAVVTTALGAEGLAVDDAPAPVIVKENAAAIAHATADLLEDAKARRALGDRAREFIAEYHSVPAYSRRLERAYAELLGSA
jgi:glycosyltransferase involved in cell wall biosynthesis